MNYRELPLIITVVIIAVMILTVIYVPHVSALVGPTITTTTIHTSTTIYTSSTTTLTSLTIVAVSTTTATDTTTITSTPTATATATQVVTSTVSTVWDTATATATLTASTTVTDVVSATATTTVTSTLTASTTVTDVVSATATTTVTETSTIPVYTASTTVTVTSTNTIPYTITSTVTGTEYLYENTTSVTFTAARNVTTTIPITQYVNTTVIRYNTTQTALYNISNSVTIMNTTYVAVSNTVYITMNRTIRLTGFYTIYVTPTIVANRTMSANITRTTTATVTSNITQLTVFLKNLEERDITLTMNGTATHTTAYVMGETVVIIGTATNYIRFINSTTYSTITNFFNVTYIKGTVISTMYVSKSTTTITTTKYARSTIYTTSYIINGTVNITSTVAPMVQGFTMNVSGAFISGAYYISVGPQAYANVFYINPSTAVALLGNYTPLNATMYVEYNDSTLAIVTAGEVSTISNAPPNVTAYVTASGYTGAFTIYDANDSPTSYLSDYEDLAYVAFMIGVGLLSNLFFRGNRLHVAIGMLSVAVLGGVVGYAFGIPLAYSSLASVVLVVSAVLLMIVERNRENVTDGQATNL